MYGSYRYGYGTWYRIVPVLKQYVIFFMRPNVMSGFGMTWKARIRKISFRIYNTGVRILTGSVVDPDPHQSDKQDQDPHQFADDKPIFTEYEPI
jgi:hypothetical protein